jgi:DNA-binding response OmpR family regulator
MKTVLIVEDSQDYSDGLKFCLSRKGYNVVTAKNGREGLQKAVGMKPDLILMDVMMPDQDGAETVAQIRAQVSPVKAPIIFLTALTSESDSGDNVLMVQGEAFPMISKMTDHEEITRVVARHLSKS